MEAVTIFVTYSPTHSTIIHNEEVDRLAKIGVKHAKKLQKEKRINMGTGNFKAKSLFLQTWASKWERQ